MDLHCLVEFQWPANVFQEDCNCAKTCDHLMYTEASLKLNTWNVDAAIPFAQKCSFRVEVLLPRMRLRRDVLFTFEDLVVSFGGAVSFFIGSNFLDMVMFLLYAMERLLKRLVRRRG